MCNALIFHKFCAVITQVMGQHTEGFGRITLPSVLGQNMIEPVQLILLLVAPDLISTGADSNNGASVFPAVGKCGNNRLIDDCRTLHQTVSVRAFARPVEAVCVHGVAAVAFV